MILRWVIPHRMMSDSQLKSRFTLDVWTVDPAFNRLVRGDAMHRVEPKVMSVLLLLAERAQSVVTKDDILRSVWPNTYVGEDALPRCISMLRHILGDDPHNPRFIQTVSKVGYCLLVEPLPIPDSIVETVPAAASYPDVSPVSAFANAPAPPTEPRVAMESAKAPISFTSALDVAKKKPRFVLTAAIFIIAVGAGLWAGRALHPKASRPNYQTLQVTTNAGEQSRPALSPDGTRVAYVWSKKDGSPQHIYIKQLGSESVQALTTLHDLEYSPVWSPDGKQIAFLSSSAAGLGLYVSSLPPNSSTRKIYIPNETTGWDTGALAWSPDGKSFLLADHLGSQPSSSIFQIDLATFKAHPLTSPPPGWEGDLTPAFSPDGQKIAFVRESESETSDLYWIPVAGGEPRQITHDEKLIHGIAWATDNQSIIFSSNRAGQPALWQVAINGGAPERLPVGTEDASQPAVSAKGDRLAFVQSSAVFGILRITQSKWNTLESKNQTIISSTAEDSAPSVSPDGKQFAFQSWRSGNQQIWLASMDGQSLRQLTPNDKHLYFAGSPSWAPSGDQLAYDCRRGGHSHIFVIAPSGGAPKQLTYGDVNDIVPRWSRDGKFIYFRSNRGGRWQLWKLPMSGEAAQPVTRDDGFEGQESPDGKWLYFARGGEDGIWRMPIGGGEETRVLNQPAAGYWGFWVVSSAGIYFLDQSQSASSPSVSVFDPATQKITPFAHLDRLPPQYSGLSLIPGTQDLLIDDKQDAGSHIAMTQGTF